jgi:DNA adenine methylase
MWSKARFAKELLPIILKYRKPYQWYVEPFCGGCNMIELVDGKRIANDYNEYVAEMWNALVNRNWQPPTEITEEQYNDIKANKEQYPKELVGFTGIAVTFGSTWFGTYARNKRGTNYAMEGRKNLMKQVERLQGTIFTSSSYCDIALPKNSIIYCDPPYEGVAGYKDKFNHTIFWQWCRDMANMGHTLFVSEYSAPDDFECVWKKEAKSSLSANGKIGGNKVSIEKLFKYKP